MKKHLILIMLAGLFTFSACSDDDDNGTESKDPIIGTWAVISVDPEEFHIDGCEETSTITFKEDNTGSATFYTEEADCIPLTTTGTWQNEGNNTYSIDAPPILMDVSGSVDFNGPNEFYFVTESGLTITFQKQ